MRLTARPAAARTLRGLRAVARPTFRMPSVSMPCIGMPSVALLAGAMVASVGMPFVGPSSVPAVPCALRTLARAATSALSLLRRGRTRIAAAGVGAVILARQRHLDQPLDVAEIAELLTAC